MLIDTCHFCGSTEAVGYQKRDKAGVLHDACWPCVRTPIQIAAALATEIYVAKPPEPDLTFLDDVPPSPVASTLQTTPKTQQSLFKGDTENV